MEITTDFFFLVVFFSAYLHAFQQNIQELVEVKLQSLEDNGIKLSHDLNSAAPCIYILRVHGQRISNYYSFPNNSSLI